MKCIQISTNMPGIGLEMSDILCIFRNKQFCKDGETNRGVQKSSKSYVTSKIVRSLVTSGCHVPGLT